MESPKTLLEAIQYFSDEQVCIDAVAEMRWPDGPICPECATAEPYYIKTQKRWKCRECRIQFSVKKGSIFEDSALSLTKWMPVLWLLVNCKNGISSYEVAKAIGVTQKSAWFMLHRLRLVLKATKSAFMFGGGEGGAVEVDETFVGGKARWGDVQAAVTEAAAEQFKESIANVLGQGFDGEDSISFKKAE
jgi:transposase-like protein